MSFKHKLWVGVVLGLMGCGYVGPNLYEAHSPVPEERVEIQVDNRNFLDATLYICWDSTLCRRLGPIRGKTLETYMTPWVANQAHIKVDFIGASNWFSLSQAVNRGDFLWFQIPAYPRLP